jgi:mono/diheme cytochrome c family protein
VKVHRSAIILFASCLLCLPSVLFAQTRTDGGLAINPVFQKNCAKCHGKTGQGRHFAGPPLMSDKTRAASDDELRIVITNGKGRMPKFADKLTPEQISTLVEQVRALNQK